MKDIDQPSEVLSKIITYAKKPLGYFLMSGSNGTGKTFAAMKIYEYNTPYKLPQKADDQAIFIKQSVLNMKYLDGLKDRELEHLANKFITTKLLVIDDLGSRNPTEAFLDFLFVILDQRWEERDRKGTVITTNFNHADLRGKLGDAITSRIVSGVNVPMFGPDRRITKP